MNNQREQKTNTYALLVGVSQYQLPDCPPLPAVRRDLSAMSHALNKGLRIEEDHIMICGIGESVMIRRFARAIQNFSQMLGEEDTFLFYFSGHGADGALAFTDGDMTIQSILDYLAQFPARNQIVFLDCCQAGNFTQEQVRISDRETVVQFAGRGISVLASSAANQPSRIHPAFRTSVFTTFLTRAIMNPALIRHGRIALADLHRLVQYQARLWNLTHQNSIQNPILRSNLVGTVYFDVGDYHPYQRKEIYLEMEECILYAVSPLHTRDKKRLAAFVLPKYRLQDSELADLTKKIVKKIRRADVYENSAQEARFRRKRCALVWCYFGLDESDMINHRYFATTCWASPLEDRKHWYHMNSNATVIKGIAVEENVSYDQLRKLQEVEIEEQEYRQLLHEIVITVVTHAEKLRSAYHRYLNQELEEEGLIEFGRDLAGTIREAYIRLSDLPMEPDSCAELTEEVYQLAGAVDDLTLVLDEKNFAEEREELSRGWESHYLEAMRRYQDHLEKIKNY